MAAMELWRGGAGVKKAMSPHRHIQPTGRVPNRNDRGVGGGEEGSGGREVYVVERLIADMVPSLPLPPGTTALAQIQAIDSKAGVVEMAGHVILKEIVRHSMDKKYGGAREKEFVGCIRAVTHQGATNGGLTIWVVAQLDKALAKVFSEFIGKKLEIGSGGREYGAIRHVLMLAPRTGIDH